MLAENQALYSERFKNRLYLIIALIGLVLIVILWRLASLQLFQHEHYTTLSKDNRVKLRPIAPIRGSIYDRKGRVLAQNTPAYTLTLIPEEVDDVDLLLQQIRAIIDVPPAVLFHFKKRFQQTEGHERVTLLNHLDEQEVARLLVAQHRLPGMQVDARLQRTYPYGPHGVHAIGHVGRITQEEKVKLNSKQYAGIQYIGKTGIEQHYESLLRGVPGYQRVEVNVSGRTVRVLDEVPAVLGNDLHLTLDIELTKVAEQALGEHQGAVVALDPRNGDVLVLASQPTFDPNTFITGLSYHQARKLNQDTRNPQFNRAIAGQYAPGSTVKPFISLASLGAGYDPDQSVFCTGVFYLPNDERQHRDWLKEGHGQIDMQGAITQSCDIYFYELSQRVQIQKVLDGLAGFGFGRESGIDLHGEQPGILPTPAWKQTRRRGDWTSGDSLLSAIGQGDVLMTPLQLASATGVLAMRGVRVVPHLLRIQPSSSVTVLAPRGETLQYVDAHWQLVQRAMRDVVEHYLGTAHQAYLGADYPVAGKTGTSQVISIAQDAVYDEAGLEKHLRDHALYIAYAPIDNPKIAIATIVENGGGGGSVAAPITRKVLDAFFSDLKAEKIAKGKKRKKAEKVAKVEASLGLSR